MRFNVNKELQAVGKKTDEQNERADNQTDRQKDRHTDSVMIEIMTEREHWTKKRGRGSNRQKNSKKDSLKRCSHKPKQYYSKQIFAFHAIPEISSLAGAFE